MRIPESLRMKGDMRIAKSRKVPKHGECYDDLVLAETSDPHLS